MATEEVTVVKGEVTYTTTLEATSCGVCGIPFAIPSDILAKRRNDGEEFYCPSWHRIRFMESEKCCPDCKHPEART